MHCILFLSVYIYIYNYHSYIDVLFLFCFIQEKVEFMAQHWLVHHGNRYGGL